MADEAHNWAGHVAGAVLAGGKASRMGGQDKALMALGGEAMIARAIARLSAQAGPLVICAGGDPARFAPFGAPVVADALPGFAGPLAGILAALDWAAVNAPAARYIATAATDTPFFPGDMVARFVAAAGHDLNAIALARTGDNVHSVFGLWPVSLAEDLRGWLGDSELRAVRAWTDRHTVIEVTFPGFDVSGELIDPFFNVNTPEDLEVACVVLEEMAG